MTDEVFPHAVMSTQRLLLRPFEPGDAADVHAVWQDERYVSTAPVGYPYTNADLATAVEWCTTGIEQHRQDGKGVGFAVVQREGGRLVGHVALFRADWAARVAEIHYWTAPWARGYGYAVEAAGSVTRWALTEQGYARIGLMAATDNTTSRRVAEKAGFRFEGVLRSMALTRDGGRADVAVYSMISADLSGE